ncbi:MAG: DUF4234 domain-containing protein [Bacilli bacterium]|nr:DUF4234 domain-containing protein [Bacilli bacterium]
MDGFSIVLAALSYIASIVALVFIIIGIVKMFKNIQTKTQKEALEETFSTLPFVALIIIYATSIVSSLITILFSVKSGGLTIFSIIYDINSLVSSILFLIFFILFKVSISKKDNLLFYKSNLLLGIGLIIKASFSFLIGILIFASRSENIVSYIVSLLMMPLEITIAFFIFNMLPKIKNYFTSDEQLIVDTKLFVIALIVNVLVIIEPMVSMLTPFILPNNSFTEILSLVKIFSIYYSHTNIVSTSSVLFIGVLSQLFIIGRRTLIKEEPAPSIKEETTPSVPLNNETQPETAKTIVVNTHWIERKNSEGKTLDLNNNIVEIHKHEKRGLVKIVLLSIITFGIYGLINVCGIVKDLNKCRQGHGETKKSMNPIGVVFLSVITLGIVPIVWGHRLTKRMSDELEYRDISYSLKEWHYWVYEILLCETVVCPIIYLHKLIKASNLINKHHNTYGDIKDMNQKELIVENSQNNNEVGQIENVDSKTSEVVQEINTAIPEIQKDPVIESSSEPVKVEQKSIPVSAKEESVINTAIPEVQVNPVIESSSEPVKAEQKLTPVSVKEENIIKNDVHDNNVASEKKARSPKERLLEAKELFDLGLISKEDYDKIKLEIIKNI